jgi:hypothetical protein
MADGAPSLRLDRVDRGSKFSSSAMLVRIWLARREVGGEVMVMLPPLFGETIGDFAGLETGQQRAWIKQHQHWYVPVSAVCDQQLLQAAYALVQVVAFHRPSLSFCSKGRV